MSSRRSFLATSASLVASAAAFPCLSRSAGAAEAKLPPAIAALPSFAGRVKPFHSEERLARIERARKLMADKKIDAIVLANSTASSRYFAGIRLGGWERMWALVLPQKGRPFLICPHFEAGSAAEEFAGGPLDGRAEVLTWQENESPYALIAKGLKDLGIATGRVGLDEQMKFAFAHGLMQAAPAIEFVSATPITAGCRMIKEAHEVECIRVAGEATLAVYQAVAESLRVGMTTPEIEALVDAAYGKVGLPGEVSINIDEFTALPHGSRKPQILKEGSILILDDGCEVEGYTSDLTRTITVGKPTAKMKQVFEIVHRAQSAARAAARPGALAVDVDRAARRVVEEAGFGPGFKYFTHRLGHGIGMDMHEWPYFVENNMFGDEREVTLKAGMILTAEPGIYISGEFGVRLEDELWITESGSEFLTRQSASLERPFGGE